MVEVVVRGRRSLVLTVRGRRAREEALDSRAGAVQDGAGAVVIGIAGSSAEEEVRSERGVVGGNWVRDAQDGAVGGAVGMTVVV